MTLEHVPKIREASTLHGTSKLMEADANASGASLMKKSRACDQMCMKWFFLSLSATIAIAAPAALAEPVSQTDPAWQQAVEQVIERYIRAHPEVIEQAFQDLQTIRHEQEQQRVKAVIASKQNDLLND